MGLERIRPLRFAGIALGFAGAAILVLPKGSLPGPGLLPVALLAVLIPAGYAAANVYAEKGRPANADNMALATGTLFAAALATGVVGLINGSFIPIWADMDRGTAILFFYAVATAVSFLIYFRIIALAGAVYLGQVGYITTLTGVGWGVAIHGETTSAWLWAAIAVVFVGVGLVNFGKRKPEKVMNGKDRS